MGIKRIRVEQHISLKKRVSPNYIQFVNQLVAKSTPATLVEHLRKRRLELGLSQKALANKLGVTFYSLSEWELGKAKMRPTYRTRVIKWLGFDPEATQ